MHCNLRPPDAVPVLISFNYDARAKFEVTQPICYHLIALLLLICCYVVTLKFDPVSLPVIFNLKHA